MITQFNTEPLEISVEEYNEDILTLAMFSESELEAYYEKLSIPKELTELKSGRLDYTENEFLISIKKISTKVDENREDNILVCIRKKFMLVVNADEESREAFLKILSAGRHGYSLEKLAAYFFTSLVHNDSKELDEIEDKISTYEDEILTAGKTDNMNSEILKIKRKLLRLRSFYEQLSDVSDMLLNNENGVINEKKIKYLRDFGNGINKLISKTDLLRESLVQLREAYQSSLDLKLNNTMKIFTVIATIFLPLTLIAGWYGMNFKYMPELNWHYGYVYVIVLSIVIAVGCIIYFKKKKFM